MVYNGVYFKGSKKITKKKQQNSIPKDTKLVVLVV